MSVNTVFLAAIQSGATGNVHPIKKPAYQLEELDRTTDM